MLFRSGVARGRRPRPHARRRLRVDDQVRLTVFARRFAPTRCLVLDDGVRVPLAADGRLPEAVPVLTEDCRIDDSEVA